MKKLILLIFALIASVFAGEMQELLCGNKSLLYCVNQFDKQCKADNYNYLDCWAVRALYEEQGLHSEAKKYYEKALSDKLEQVKTLIEKEGVDIATVGTDILFVALYAKHLEVVKYLIDKGVDINAELFGETALMVASVSGDLELVKYLISKGADINAKNDMGFTALMKASVSGHLEVVKYLISKGADINAKNEVGWTALMCASFFLEDGTISEKHHKIVEVLKNAGAKTAKEIKK